MSCPMVDAGRFAVVVMKPLELPLQAWRPASGFENALEITPLYPPVTKFPPAARMSVNAPPSIESSSTPPSYGSEPRSRLKLFRNVTRGAVTFGTAIVGESSRLSLMTAGSSTDAAFGCESAGGEGTPESDVVQSGGAPWAFVAVQAGGSVGGVT